MKTQREEILEFERLMFSLEVFPVETENSVLLNENSSYCLSDRHEFWY